MASLQDTARHDALLGQRAECYGRLAAKQLAQLGPCDATPGDPFAHEHSVQEQPLVDCEWPDDAANAALARRMAAGPTYGTTRTTPYPAYRECVPVAARDGPLPSVDGSPSNTDNARDVAAESGLLGIGRPFVYGDCASMESVRTRAPRVACAAPEPPSQPFAFNNVTRERVRLR